MAGCAELFDVRGRVAVITGGTRGIGRMIASILVRRGMHVFVTGRDPAACEETVRALGAQACDAVPADLAHEAEIQDFVTEVVERTSAIHLLVNNAGRAWSAPFGEFPAAGWDRDYALNVRAPFLLAQAFAPVLGRSATDDHWSRIVNVSSVGASMIGESPASNPAYKTSKAAVEHLTRVLCRQMVPYRTTVNCIAPGWFPTRMNAPLADQADEWIASTPVGRLGNAADVGGVVTFLASRAGSYVNGQIITVDGGRGVT